MMAPHWLSFGVGFLSLSQEILWMRLYVFACESVPQAMMAVLLAYLSGIALGAAAGREYCSDSSERAWRACGVILVSSFALDLVAPMLFAWSVGVSGQKIIGLIVIFASASVKAAVFPVAHHLGTPANGDRVGHSLSRVYAMNIVGAALGPLVTGFVLLGTLTTQQCMWLAACGSLLLGLLCLDRAARKSHSTARIGRYGATLALCGLGLLVPEQLVSHVSAANGLDLRRVVETRQGIVASYHGGRNGDLITGGNVYDGTTNLDPVINSNLLERVLVLPLLKPQPRRVLMIGLSVGTWLKLVTAFPGVEVIDVVEINPGYLDLIQDYPAQASALRDPRVRLHIDDGRRWLRAQKHTQQYDLIIMNTSFHWRSFATNVLSVEFLRELSAHMKADGILAYNSTSSPDVMYSAEQVFSTVYLYVNFVIAGMYDFRPALAAKDAPSRLRDLRLDGVPVFPPADETAIARLLATPLRSVDEIRERAGRPLTVVSDHNLATEYRYGRPFLF